MPQFDTIIKGGTIVDGTLLTPYKGDVGIKNGVITKIGHLKSSDAKQVLDASGLIVAPGVIDLHCHYDAPIHWDPSCSIGSWHGVTSVTNGNCWFGFAPVPVEQVIPQHVIEPGPRVSNDAAVPPLDKIAEKDLLHRVARAIRVLRERSGVPGQAGGVLVVKLEQFLLQLVRGRIRNARDLGGELRHASMLAEVSRDLTVTFVSNRAMP